MRTPYRTTVFVLLALFVSSTAALAIPKWFTATEYKQYQKETHFLGTGTGQTLEEAAYRAQYAIASQIETSLEGEFTSMVESYRVDDREEIQEQTRSTVRTAVSGVLAGAETVESTEENGTFYAMVVMEKANYARVVKQKADEIASSLASMEGSAESLLDRGEVFGAIEVLLSAEEDARELMALRTVYTTVSGASYPGAEPSLSGGALLARVRKILADVQVRTESGDDQLGMRGNLLPAPLVAEVYYRGDGKTPMSGVPMRLLDEEDRVMERATTGADGLVEFYARAIGEGRGKYTVVLDLPRMPRLLRRELRDLRETFRYRVAETPPLTFAIDIRGFDGQPDRSVTKNVAQSVEKAGHNINGDAPFLLFGELRPVGDPKKLNQLGDELTQVKVEMQLFLRDQATGNTFGSISVTSVGQSKQGADAAQAAASRRMKVSARDMGKLLSEAAGKLSGQLEAMSSTALERANQLYAQGKYDEALAQLALVSEGSENVQAAEKLVAKIRDERASGAELSDEMKQLRQELLGGPWKNYAEETEVESLNFLESGEYELDGELVGGWRLLSETEVSLDLEDGDSAIAELSDDASRLSFEGMTFIRQ